MPEGLHVPEMLRPEPKFIEFREHEGLFAQMDFDGGIRYEGAPSVESLMRSLVRVHNELRDAVHLTATKEAIRRWRGE